MLRPRTLFALSLAFACAQNLGCATSTSSPPSAGAEDVTAVPQEPQASPDESLIEFVDEALSLIESRGLHAEAIDWGERKAAFGAAARGGKSMEELLAMFQALFDEMKDNHSFFYYDDQKFASNVGQLDPESVPKPLIDALDAGEGVVRGELVDGVGYLRIPQDNSPDDAAIMQRSAEMIQAAIAEVAREQPVGWIIDLRLNTGGTMYPMILGLEPFLADGVFASNQKRSGEVVAWSLREHAIFEGERSLARLSKPFSEDLSQARVVVLTSGITGSSGEITALAFLNRANTHFVGETSAGFMTVNEMYELPKDVILLLAEGREMDSEGKLVERIEPETVLVEGDNFASLSEDTKVARAIEWIRG